jgi:excisionase family DNA binding protein
MRANVGLSVAEAAQRLGISTARVRALAQAGLLDAARVGQRWIVAPESVDRRLAAGVDQGRPLDARTAWALLWLASGDPALQRLAEGWLTPWARSRARGRLKRVHWPSLAPRLRARAAVHRLRAHPSDLPRIADEPDVVRTGVSAAAAHGLDVAGSGVLDAYVPARALPDLARRYLLEASEWPNVVLRAVGVPWPFPPGQFEAPALVVALDLLDSDDSRSRRAATECLARTTPP